MQDDAAELPNRAAYVWGIVETKEASSALQANVEALHRSKLLFFSRCYMGVSGLDRCNQCMHAMHALTCAKPPCTTVIPCDLHIFSWTQQSPKSPTTLAEVCSALLRCWAG